jgi:hypothetical protein
MPASISVMVNALIDLCELTGDVAFADRAATALRSISGFVAETPAAATNSVRALLRLIVLSPASMERVFGAVHEHGSDSPSASDNPDDQPVKVLCDREVVKVRSEVPGLVRLCMQIAEGYHINAAVPVPDHDPAAESPVHLVPLRVGVVNGTGVEVFAEYPEGEPYGRHDEIRVHRGVIEFPVILERSGEWGGTPVLVVSFQVCTDDTCFAPARLELQVEIERG